MRTRQVRIFPCCTKGSLRSPSVQRAAAAPQLHKVLPPVALRTTAVLQNSEKNPRFARFFFGTSQSRSALADRLKTDIVHKSTKTENRKNGDESKNNDNL